MLTSSNQWVPPRRLWRFTRSFLLAALVGGGAAPLLGLAWRWLLVAHRAQLSKSWLLEHPTVVVVISTLEVIVFAALSGYQLLITKDLESRRVADWMTSDKALRESSARLEVESEERRAPRSPAREIDVPGAHGPGMPPPPRPERAGSPGGAPLQRAPAGLGCASVLPLLVLFVAVLAAVLFIPVLIMIFLIHPDSYKKGILLSAFLVSLIVASLYYYRRPDPITVEAVAAILGFSITPPTVLEWLL
jgi:hypothetical protein